MLHDAKRVYFEETVLRNVLPHKSIHIRIFPNQQSLQTALHTHSQNMGHIHLMT